MMITVKHKDGEITCDIGRIQEIIKVNEHQDQFGRDKSTYYYFRLMYSENFYYLTLDQYNDLLKLVR